MTTATTAPVPRLRLRLRLLGMPAWCAGHQPWQALARKDAALLARLGRPAGQLGRTL